MISKTIKISLLAAALISFSFADAQDVEEKKRPTPEKQFKKLDADANGSISLEEFKAKRMKDESKASLIEKRFEKMDSDSNGSLSMVEFKAALAQIQKRKDRRKKQDN